MLEQVSLLENEKLILEKQSTELRQKTEQIERRAVELRAAEEKKHQEEIEILKKTNMQLKVYSCIFSNKIRN